MKQLLLLSVCALLMVSCGSDDDGGGTSSSFTFDGRTFNLFEGVPTIQYLEIIQPWGELDSAVQSPVTVTGFEAGSNNLVTGSALFVLMRSSPDIPLSGSYQIVNRVQEVDLDSDSTSQAILQSTGRVCEGWPTQFQSLGGGLPQTIWNNPSGTVDITLHDDNTMSVNFMGSLFYQYSFQDLSAVDSAALQLNIRGLAMKN